MSSDEIVSIEITPENVSFILVRNTKVVPVLTVPFVFMVPAAKNKMAAINITLQPIHLVITDIPAASEGIDLDIETMDTSAYTKEYDIEV